MRPNIEAEPRLSASNLGKHGGESVMALRTRLKHDDLTSAGAD
jgi:hypothetical protein